MNYIKEVRINRFMNGRNVKWTLISDSHRHVDILVGINGSGKTTLLNLIKAALSKQDDALLDYVFMGRFAERIEINFLKGSIIIDTEENSRTFINFSKEDFENINVTFISTFDALIPPLDKPLDAIKRLLGYDIKTTLDLDLSEQVLKFRAYKEQIDIQVLKLIKSSQPLDLSNFYGKIDQLYQIIDTFFEETGKKIDRETSPFTFYPQSLSFLQLSSGEKQLLLLLIVAFLQEKDKLNIILLDEPEISLHLRWQQILLQNLITINPYIQWLMVTHSPSIYGKGFIVNRQDIETIFQNNVETKLPMVLSEISFIGEVELQEIAIKINDIEKKQDKTYQFNLILVDIKQLSFNDFKKIKDLIKNKIDLDFRSYEILMNRIYNFEDGKKLLKEIKEKNISFNEKIINVLLKKVSDVAEGLKYIIQSLNDENNYNVDFPNITSFSILVGKINEDNKNVVSEIETLRKYCNVKANETYLQKLNRWKV